MKEIFFSIWFAACKMGKVQCTDISIDIIWIWTTPPTENMLIAESNVQMELQQRKKNNNFCILCGYIFYTIQIYILQSYQIGERLRAREAKKPPNRSTNIMWIAIVVISLLLHFFFISPVFSLQHFGFIIIVDDAAAYAFDAAPRLHFSFLCLRKNEGEKKMRNGKERKETCKK